MDILFSKLTLFAFAIMMVTAFIVYSVTAIRRIGSVTYFKAVGQMCKGIAKALGAFATALIGLLASSAKTSDTNEASENAMRGGVLNYRTGKFDDGTDATGWYEKD
jgi:hypothetical protein